MRDCLSMRAIALPDAWGGLREFLLWNIVNEVNRQRLEACGNTEAVTN